MVCRKMVEKLSVIFVNMQYAHHTPITIYVTVSMTHTHTEYKVRECAGEKKSRTERYQ